MEIFKIEEKDIQDVYTAHINIEVHMPDKMAEFMARKINESDLFDKTLNLCGYAEPYPSCINTLDLSLACDVKTITEDIKKSKKILLDFITENTEEYNKLNKEYEDYNY